MCAWESMEARQRIENLAGRKVKFLAFNKQNCLRLEIITRPHYLYKTVKSFTHLNCECQLSCQGNSYLLVGIVPHFNISGALVRLDHLNGRYKPLPHVRKVLVKMEFAVFTFKSNRSQTERN